MALNYNDLVTQVSSAIVVDSTNAAFLTALPNWIAYAENRLYRELDLLDANIRDGSASCTPNSRNFNLPVSVGTFLILDSLNVITPASTAPDSGTRNPLVFVSQAVLDWTWPSVTGATVPTMAAYISQNTYLSPSQTQVLLGPWPDQAYRIECCGKFQPTPISASNLSSWLTDNLWDLMFAATMIAASSWTMNFGAAGTDNPQLANTWEAMYQQLMQSGTAWAARARLAGASWSSKALEPTAQPQRG